MADRKLCELNDHTHMSFVREVEVIRVRTNPSFSLAPLICAPQHILPHSVVSYIAVFSTRVRHRLVHVSGGDLAVLVMANTRHAALGKACLQETPQSVYTLTGPCH